jgi:hypothetical protein
VALYQSAAAWLSRAHDREGLAMVESLLSSKYQQLGELDLHLIVGRNEAGKSSLRQAIVDLLYGIPVRTQYDFKHVISDLLLGGALENGGESLEFLRFKRNYKPYSVRLLDVAKRDYVGTATPRDYSSTIQLVDPDRKFERDDIRIWIGCQDGCHEVLDNLRLLHTLHLT